MTDWTSACWTAAIWLSEGCVAAQSAYLHVRKPQRLTMTDLWT